MADSDMKFKIEAPCCEDWELMTSADKGRFCRFCEKTVYDFTNKSAEEINAVLSQTENNTCGRFKYDQIQHTAKTNLLRYFFPALLLAFWGWLFVPTTIASNVLRSENQAVSPQDPVSETNYFIKVQIFDKRTRKPIKSKIVYLSLPRTVKEERPLLLESESTDKNGIVYFTKERLAIELEGNPEMQLDTTAIFVWCFVSQDEGDSQLIKFNKRKSSYSVKLFIDPSKPGLMGRATSMPSKDRKKVIRYQTKLEKKHNS